METTLLPLFAILVVLFGFVALIVGLRLSTSSELDRRLQDFVIEPVTTRPRFEEETFYRRPEISGSILTRTIDPLFRGLGMFFSRLIPGGSIEDLDRQMVIAGNPLGLRGREFAGMRVIFLLLGGFLAYVIITRFDGIVSFIVAIGAAMLIFFLPKLWLRTVVRGKQENIRRHLPDAMDMLSVCADAGLGFDQSLQRVSESWEGPIAIEFVRVVNEMNMGETRASAMRSMAERLDVPEVSSFVAVILQSYELGMGIAETLHAQADQMRTERRYWAQEQARKMPTKMLFPLMLLILPAMFAVIMGPTIPALREILSSVNLGNLGP
ncbi:MAG: type II secretion system F family protein [Anaerolineales bacterium]